jgi:hypothetical protein
MANFNKSFKRKLQMKKRTKHYYNIMLCGVPALWVRHVLMAHNIKYILQPCILFNFNIISYESGKME